MIEINLLPPQYRTVERTPLPVFLGLITGIVAVAGLGLFVIGLSAKGRALEERRVQRAAVHERMKKEVEDVRKLDRELQESQGRIDTVLGIAESKVYWSVKLDQLARLLPSGTVWLEGLTLDPAKLQLVCKARGSSWQRFTDLRQRLRNDTNFDYQFDQIPLTPIEVVNPGPQYTEPSVLSFSMTLPLRQVEQGPQGLPR